MKSNQLDTNEFVVRVVEELTMDFETIHDSLLLELTLMKIFYRNHDENERIALFQLQLEWILNCYNRHVVFYGNNLEKKRQIERIQSMFNNWIFSLVQ